MGHRVDSQMMRELLAQGVRQFVRHKQRIIGSEMLQIRLFETKAVK